MGGTDRELNNELARLQEEKRILESELACLRRFLKSLQRLTLAADRQGASEDVMALLGEILRDALAAIGAEDGSLLIRDEETGELVFVLAEGAVPVERLGGTRLPPGKGIAGWVVQNREPAIVENPYGDERFYAEVDDAFQFHTSTIMAAPIIGAGRVLGAIEVLNKGRGKTFDADDLLFLTLVCRYAGELLCSLEDRLSEGAPTPLTPP